MQKQLRKQEKDLEADNAPQPSKEAAQKGEDLKAEIDELLDDIDSVLEQNSTAFVKSYIQENGE